MKRKTKTLVVRGGRVLLPDGRLVRTDLRIEGQRIAAVGAGGRADEVIAAAGAMVVPGFVDIHTHGIGYESTSGSLAKYAELEAPEGGTSLFPTLFGHPDETTAHIRRHMEETDGLRATPQITGLRLESPYLARTGAGVSKDLAKPTRNLTEHLLKTGAGHVRIWDVSPELPGAIETISSLTRRGIVCSMAHTSCTIDQARAAVEAGMRLVTHLFCTFEVPKMTDPGVYPASLTDYCLLEDRLTCEIIPDGTHVHPLLVEKTFRCKPTDRLVFVTDSNFGAGLKPGDYVLPQGWGRVRIKGPNDGVRLIDREMGLAGSALTPINSFRNAIRIFGKDVATASRICSLNPARLLGLNKGELAKGRDADVVVLDRDLNVLCTIAQGQVVYRAARCT